MANDTNTPVNNTRAFSTPAAVAAGSGLAGSIITSVVNAAQARKQREWNEQMQDKQNAWSLEQWNRTNEYNSPVAQIERLKEAGLNPLYYGLDGTSANSFESAAVLGYDRASMSAQDNPIMASMNALTQMRTLEKDIELKNAQIDKLTEDTTGVKLDNEFKDKTLNARVQAEELANSLTQANINKVNEEKKQIFNNILKTIEETKNERAKGLLIEAERNLKDMQAKEIVELLPYQKNLISAQTEAQKAAASASYYNAMMNKRLINGGYIENMLDKAAGEAQDANARAAVDSFKAAVRTGNIFTIDNNDWFVTKAGKKFLNNLFYDISVVGEAVTGPIAGLVK